ncbi:MAG: hypothetical protein AB1413_03275 [Thermodesulfobacteriota bacterium]
MIGLLSSLFPCAHSIVLRAFPDFHYKHCAGDRNRKKQIIINSYMTTMAVSIRGERDGRILFKKRTRMLTSVVVSSVGWGVIHGNWRDGTSKEVIPGWREEEWPFRPGSSFFREVFRATLWLHECDSIVATVLHQCDTVPWHSLLFAGNDLFFQ